jgi:hypothetical protein
MKLNHYHLTTCWRLLALPLLLAVGHAQQSVDSFGSAVTLFKTTPKLLVFIHGATPEPRAAGDVPQPSSGTLDFARFYWGRSFVENILGFTSAADSGMKTLSGHALTSETWDGHEPANAQNNTVLRLAVNESELGDHFLVPGSYTGNATPPVSGMLTYRDGSRGLIDQSEKTINQIYDLYKRQYGSVEHPLEGRTRPAIVLVTHSMGASVARVIMCAASDPVSGDQLRPQTIAKAKALRDKILYTISMAGPHEGSPLATEGQRILNQVNAPPPALLAMLNLLPGNPVAVIQRKTAEELGRPAINDLTPTIWNQLNTGALHPSRAHRGDGSMIPIYTLIGHTPAGKFFTDPTDEDQWPRGGMTGESASTEAKWRETLRSFYLCIVDYLAHNHPGQEPQRYFWGRLASPGGRFDQVARYHREALGFDTPFTDPILSPPGHAPGFPLGFPTYYTRTNAYRNVLSLNIAEGVHNERVALFKHRDKEVDSDGLVSVRSGAGYTLGSATDAFYGSSERWPHGTGQVWGSWFRLRSASQNDGNRPWRYLNHEQIHRDRATGEWLRTHIVSVAGPLCTGNPLSTWPSLRLSQHLKLNLLDTHKLEASHLDTLLNAGTSDFGGFMLNDDEDDDDEDEDDKPNKPVKPIGPQPDRVIK